jgi:hypothetical protein
MKVYPPHIKDMLKKENYFKLPYDEDAYWFLGYFCIFVAVMCVVFSKMSARKPKKVARKPAHVFEPKAKLSPKDQVVIDMLDPLVHNYVVTDPSLPDNPIVYASDAFCEFTEYTWDEIVGRNCRFLQGEGTDKTDIARIRSAVSNGSDENVCLQNFKKSGTPFVNQFFIAALREEGKGHNNILYHLGVQHEVDSIKPGQFPENAGWVYSMGSRIGEPNNRVRTPSRG